MLEVQFLAARFQRRVSCENMMENVHIPPLGPPGPTENHFFMREVVMSGLKMLGLVKFDKKSYVLFFKKENNVSVHSLAHRKCLSVGLV